MSGEGVAIRREWPGRPGAVRPEARVERGAPSASEMYDDAGEVRLIERARAGDRDALGNLLALHEARLFAVCLRTVGNREAARDLTQDSLVKVIQSLANFDGRAKFGTWVTRIAVNTCLSHLRKERLRRHASLDAPGPSVSGRGGGEAPAAATLPGREQGPGSGVEEREALARLDRALARLDGEQRAILALRDVRGLDYEQIAAALETPVGTVKSRLFRARSALREAMESLERDRDS